MTKHHERIDRCFEQMQELRERLEKLGKETAVDITALRNRVIDLEAGAQPAHEPDPEPDPLEQTRRVMRILGNPENTASLVLRVIGSDGIRRTTNDHNYAMYIVEMEQWLDEHRPCWYISSNEGSFVVNTPGEQFIEAPTRREALELAVLALAKGE